MYLPINLDISEKRVLIIGGGNVALQKINALLPFTTNIRVIAPEISDPIKEQISDIEVRPYNKGDINSRCVVYACTNDRELNRQIKRDANNVGALVCVADDPPLCDFISPAVFKKDHMVVSVSSSGKEVKKSIQWRNKIREIFK